MIRGFVFLVLVAFASLAQANNVRVTNFAWEGMHVSDDNVLKLTFTLSWDHSWRDAYNYDAVYVFFKFKKKEETNTLQSAEEWQHLYLLDAGHTLTANEHTDAEYTYWLSPLSQEGVDKNTGIYVFRKAAGAGNSSIDVEVSWRITDQKRALTRQDLEDNRVLISVHALEMVYIPRGAFRAGDNVSSRGFSRKVLPILPEYDLVKPEYKCETSALGKNPELAADRLDYNGSDDKSAWVGNEGGDWWSIDFGEPKAITYFGINASRNYPANIPTEFQLQGQKTIGDVWDPVWEGPGPNNWNLAKDAYPIEKAIKIENASEKVYRRYRVIVRTMTGRPVINSVGMTDVNLEELADRTALIDGPVVLRDSLYGLWTPDSTQWEWSGQQPATFPNGYKNFYAMKYEITQEQYVGFLNKLNYVQQNVLLNERLDTLQEGTYIFSGTREARNRNGIVLKNKIPGMPAIFANDLNPADSAGQEQDGQELACNYMSMADMLAYADWAGLRPLTELEYEKMSRPCYPYKPRGGEYAWNTTGISPVTTLSDPGTTREKATGGNANYGGNLDLKGPVRAGAFATGVSGHAEAGAGYWGGMELSGNLAEMYYRANNPNGMTLLWPETYAGGKYMTAHGNGYLAPDGGYDGSDAGKKWTETVDDLILRGGSFQSAAGTLRVSDRSAYERFAVSLYDRDSTVTFRLGRSLPEKTHLLSVLTLENDASTGGTKNVSDTVACDASAYYIVRGNRPAEAGKVCAYIWYMQVPGGNWMVLEKEEDKDLIFKDFQQDRPMDQIFRFKRKVVTPDNDSEESSAFYVEVVFKGKSL